MQSSLHKTAQVAISLKVPEDQQPVIRERINQMLADVDGMKQLAIQFDSYF